MIQTKANRMVLGRSHVRQWLGITVTALAAVYFGKFFVDHFHDVSLAEQFDIVGGYLLVATLILATVPIACSSLAWWLLLKSLNAKLGFSKAMWILAITQVAKYLPGNVVHHLGRIELAKNFGVLRKDVAWSMMLEGLLILAAGVVAVLLVAAVVGPGIFGPAVQAVEPLEIGLLVVVVVAAIGLPWWVLNVWRPQVLQRFLGSWRLARPSLMVLLFCGLLYLLNGFVTAAVIKTLLANQINGQSMGIWVIFGAWTIAWLVGFLSPGAPAGLMVREAVLVSILSPFMDAGSVLSLTVWQRLLTTAGEGVVFVAAFLVRKRFITQQRGATQAMPGRGGG